MKKIILLLATFILYITAQAQEELHIHHINVENGDATMIGIYNTVLKKYTSKTLIDGGLSASGQMLMPYLKKITGEPTGMFFKYVVLTHYHTDHYTGLYALKRGEILADSLVDPGGYGFSQVFTEQANLPVHVEEAPRKLKIASNWLDIITAAAQHQPAYLKARNISLSSFGTGAGSGLGKKILLGNIAAEPVYLQCVAGWGNTLGANGQVVPNPSSNEGNANNFSLAFILSYGQFRYFIGGDLGGDSDGQYINQETALSAYMAYLYPVAHSGLNTTTAAGHICGFKANHHGSEHSNSTPFLEAMHPAITITSAGNKADWHLPSMSYLKRLAEVKPLSVWVQHAVGTFNQGVYFTNLYNWPAFKTLNKAVSLYSSKSSCNFDYGNSTAAKAGYMIRVKAPDIAQRSLFEVDRVDITATSPYKVLAYYYCHNK